MKNDNLFRFEVFATSKQLGDALAVLSGRVAQITPPQLVANAKANGKGVTHMSGTELVEMFAEYLRKHKLRTFTAVNTKAFLSSVGRSPGSSSYLQTQAKEYGLIKNIGDSATTSKWQVVSIKKKSAPKKRKAVAS